MSAKRGKKYRLVEQENLHGLLYWRIEALRDIPRHGVRAGDKGGLIEEEENLSQDGDAWVGDNATVNSGARVYGDAHVYDGAHVSYYAHVYGNAQVYG
jgi:hypothetical protein